MKKQTLKPELASLKEIRIFESFDEPELEEIIALGSSITYEPHTNVVIEGELSWGLYIILDGIVGVLKNNKLTGQSYDIGHLRSGNSFGEMSLVDENPRSATIKTLTQTDLFYIPKEGFTNFIDSSSDIKFKFLSNCIKKLVIMMRELDENYVISQYQLWQTALKKKEESS